MTFASLGLLVAAVGMALLPGCKAKGPPPCASCAKARLANQWCDACRVGYVAGVPIQCRVVFECLDAHGHDLVLSTFTCPECRAAIRTGGFCEKCKIGWVGNKTYFSRLTYHLAKGRPRDPAAIACPVCRKNTEKCGWCDACKLGMVGNVAIANRADFDGGRRGYDLMRAAIQASRRCETCALAILTDTSCFFCKIAYKDGKEVHRPGA